MSENLAPNQSLVTEPKVDGSAAPETEKTAVEDAKEESAEATKEVPADKTDAEPKAEEPKQEEPKKVVPEKYDLKLPDGAILDASYIEKISDLAKAKGFSNEEAQERLNETNKFVSSFVEGQKALAATVNDKQWYDELKNDREIGGDKFTESGQLAYNAAVEIFGEEFPAKIAEMKLNHNPMLFRGLVKLGKLMANDKTVTGGKLPKAEKSMAERIYPQNNKEQ